MSNSLAAFKIQSPFSSLAQDRGVADALCKGGVGWGLFCWGLSAAPQQPGVRLVAPVLLLWPEGRRSCCWFLHALTDSLLKAGLGEHLWAQ